MKKLNNLTKLVKKRKTIGRGGSRGGTSGKGNKGQKARSGGKISLHFEGGQMPLTRRLPKRGFNNSLFNKKYTIVNLNLLNNKFNSGDTVNKEILIEKGIIKNNNCFIKILASGSSEFNKKLIVYADAFSNIAKEYILNKGGQVILTKEL